MTYFGSAARTLEQGFGFYLVQEQELVSEAFAADAALEIIPPAVNTDLGGKGLHTFGVDVNEFTTAIVKQLEEGQLEAAYGFAAESSQASREQLDLIFKRMNQRQ